MSTVARPVERHGATALPARGGGVLFGLAGGMLVVAGALVGGYYVMATRSEAHAATAEPAGVATEARRASVKVSPALSAMLAREVGVKTHGGVTRLTWSQLGVELDPDEVERAGALTTDAELGQLAAKGSLPVRVDRDKAVRALAALKAKVDTAPTDAYLDLEDKTIHADLVGHGIDVWASLPRVEAAARQAAPSFELATVAMPARVTKEALGIDDISHVLGHFTTRFPVTDRDRNFNLKLAASKINGTVIKPGVEWSFNAQVGERSQKEGYKIAHVITAGEMVDGLAGGTCQISTTLFGAAFFAGLDIVKTTNHSRPSVYTPLGFDATVVWPNTDLVLKNPYEFPVAIHYRVANGEAVVEVLGKPRPWDKIVFARKIVEKDEKFPEEERLDDEMPDGQTVVVQDGFPGLQLVRYRRFFQGKKQVKEQRWAVTYKPVTKYIRRGTNKSLDAKPVPEHEAHGPKVPTSDDFAMAQ